VSTPTELVPLDRSDITLAADIERSRFLPVMQIDQALERREVLVKAFQKLLKPSSRDDSGDYGKVAGIGKPTLMQAGAQKLDNLFGLVPRFEIIEREEDWSGEKHGGEPFFRYLVRCQLLRSEFVMGEAIGECNSWESKYRYRTAERKCPKCNVGAIIQTKHKSGPNEGKAKNFWCAPFKGGCGQGFALDSADITGQETGRKPNPEIFDQVNTLLKMAQKRAHVGATINATSASEFFTQEDSRPVDAVEPTEKDVRPVPEQLRDTFNDLDSGSTTGLKGAFKFLEDEIAINCGAAGLSEFDEMKADYKRAHPQGNRTAIKSLMLDAWELIEEGRESRASSTTASITDDDVPF
jgi:hypothetical protein